MSEIVLKTIHGSHLYGLAHSGSDKDYYVVVNNRHLRRRAHQTIVDGVDTFTIDLTYWLYLCEQGAPQALEAMYSPCPEIDKLGDFRRSFRVNWAKANQTYMRTMRNFAEMGDYKRSRHSLRLWVNLQEINEKGYFDPRLSQEDIEWVSEYADSAKWFLQ